MGKEMYMMSFKHLLMPESKDVRRRHTETYITHNNGGRVRGTQEPITKFPNGQSWNNLGQMINKIVLDYNTKYKIYNHELILI